MKFSSIFNNCFVFLGQGLIGRPGANDGFNSLLFVSTTSIPQGYNNISYNQSSYEILTSRFCIEGYDPLGNDCIGWCLFTKR